MRKSRAICVGKILDDMFRVLNEIKFTEKEYQGFLKDMKEYAEAKLDDVIIEKRSLNGSKTNKERKVGADTSVFDVKPRNAGGRQKEATRTDRIVTKRDNRNWPPNQKKSTD